VILIIALVVVFVFDLSETQSVVLIVGACVLEIAEILGLRLWSKRLGKKQPPRDPDQQLVGLVGEVVTACRPAGQIRIRGELWAATCGAGADPGESVRVDAVDSLTLVVSPAA
jgi:membrane protein implicated in regulation of membrane protease activity